MSTTLRPTTLAEARDAIRDTAGTLLFRGAGSRQSWGGALPAIDTVIDTTAMDGLLTHDAADATVSVQAGMPLADLQKLLAADDQWLAIDPPETAADATVGGLFVAEDAGPARLRYGTMRDLVIGATFVLSDGTVGRTGGFVIKNVAGFDMAKLLCGSLGTLGLVVELVLRVHPVPEAWATLRVPAAAAAAVDVCTALGATAVEPTALDWADGAVWLRVAGHPDAVTQQRTAARDAVSELDAVDATDVEVLDGDDDTQLWRRLTAALRGGDGQTVVRGACPSTTVGQAAEALTAAADAAGVDAKLSAHLGLGVLTATLSGADAEQHAACVRAWREQLIALGGHAVVRRRIAGLDDLVDCWGPPPSAIGLMRRVKQALDPDNRCAPGRFVGGI